MNLMLNQETIVRLVTFIGVLSLMIVWEKMAPRRTTGNKGALRRINNLVLVIVNTVILRISLSVAAVGMAVIARERGWGIFNMFAIPDWIAMAISFLCLDLVIYTQHVMFHKVPLLWRLHRVHHTDTEFDTTTGVRFHPVEILISMCIKMAVVVMVGIPVLLIIIFEIVLNAMSLFNHGNVYIAPWLDHCLRYLIVTPDMHRVHHSIIRAETDSNYGFNFSWWDRLFSTYRAQPASGHTAMQIGLAEFRGEKSVNVLWLLIQPFLNSDN